MPAQYRQYLILTTAFSLILFPSCTSLEKTVSAFGRLFKGNTSKKITDYSHEERAAYRNYTHLKKVMKREQEKEILLYMDELASD